MASVMGREVLLVCVVMMGAFFGVAFSAQSCSTLLTSNNGFTACQDLTELASTLAWRINNASSTIDFAFSGSAPSAAGWVGWGINPTAAAMAGTQALIAYTVGGVAQVNKYPITNAIKMGSPCAPGTLSGVNFSATKADISGSEMTIYATLALQASASLSMNHVWNVGPSVDTSTLEVAPHATSGANLASVASIDLATAQASSVELPNQKLKDRHGLISAVAWGLLLPLGVMAARYLRPFSNGNPTWFYTHVACQCTGYALGVVAWAMGLTLHSVNEGAVPTRHRNLGISIFALATLQVLALFLRPKPDAKYRKYWNVYHHSVGYATIVLIIVNIFEGLDLLQPGDKWTLIYTIILCILGATSLITEIVTWSMWVRHRNRNNTEAMYGSQFKGTSAYRSGQLEAVV